MSKSPITIELSDSPLRVSLQEKPPLEIQIAAKPIQVAQVVGNVLVVDNSVTSQSDQLVTSLYPAGEALSALRMVKLGDDGSLYYAEPSEADRFALLGMTLQAAAVGEYPRIALSGRVEDSAWQWPQLRTALYLGVQGTLATAPPTSGAAIQIATIMTTDTIALTLQLPIILT